MLKQLWVTGILVAFSIFGIKVGLGLSAQIYSRAISVGKKMILIMGALFAYLILFFCLYYLITHFNLLDYLDRFMNMLSYGMLLHLIVALGLLFWGVKLLLQLPKEEKRLPFRAGLLLILPCPVCATVILLNLTLAYSLFSLSSFLTTLTLFAVFIGIIVLTMGLIFPFRHKILSGHSFLGMSMMLIALYFLFSIIIAPIYPKLKAAFAMASSNNPVKMVDPVHMTVLFVFVFIIGGVGFIKNFFSKGESK